MKTILAAIDTSGTAEAVVAEAAELARLADARVVLFTAVQLPIVATEYAPVMQNFSELKAAGEKAAATHLATLKKRLSAHRIATETVHLTGAPTALILEQARKHAADFIVMGSHGHTAFYDLLVGSTTHGVLLRARCPVVIVPKKALSRRPSRRRRT